MPIPVMHPGWHTVTIRVVTPPPKQASISASASFWLRLTIQQAPFLPAEAESLHRASDAVLGA